MDLIEPFADVAMPPPTTLDRAGLANVIRTACARIAPVFPLDRFVAVNPYLGLSDHHFHDAAERLSLVAGAHTTMGVAYYREALDQGRIVDEDVADALADRYPTGHVGAAQFVRSVHDGGQGPGDQLTRFPTVADVATARTGHDWARFSIDRISAWSAAYFDEGQATWRSADRTAPVFESWRAEAAIDRTPEIMGLRRFRATVRSLPADPFDAAELVLAELGVSPDCLELFLHSLLLRVGGWAAFAARVVWDRQLLGEDDDTLRQFLAVLLGWELAILRAFEDEDLHPAWTQAMADIEPVRGAPDPGSSLAQLVVLQDAFDRSEQRRLVASLASHSGPKPDATRRASTQAVFCIDVRSEVLRRHLEATDPAIETIGFAGFFGIPISYVPVAHDRGDALCPALLSPAYTVLEAVPGPDRMSEIVEQRRLRHHVRRAWKSFKMGAISCFSFVGPVGLVYLPKLITDSHGSSRPVRRPDDESLSSWAVAHKGPSLASGTSPTLTVGIPAADRVELAEGALRGMSLTDGFAPLVLITGHGATTVNNPYDAGLACGACGGHPGGTNARVAAEILNDPHVRDALADRGICIPDDTWFLAAQHDTTTDEVTVFDRHLVPDGRQDLVAGLDAHLVEAGGRARAERAARLGIDGSDPDAAIIARSADWAQVRPEWGLAGCSAFIAGPRTRTRGLDLGGRSFLHSYDWRQDEGFAVLALVMTAPMVVASWISLQYYASTVDNRLFGSGNKTLHNVVGRVGVLEGNAGDLRTGLPWQSVHDGDALQHEPVRLSVVIEAPIDAMNEVLAAHPAVRELCDNAWVHLFAMDETGTVTHRYTGPQRWDRIEVR